MFYNLTDAQVAKIKSNFYPQEEFKGQFLRRVIVNDYGTDNADNSVRIVYNFKDGLQKDESGNQIYKVFNNLQAKKYMKLKIFEILSQNMLDELKSTDEIDIFNDIATLENVINKYGALSRDLSPSYDFIGDKVDPNLHIKEKDGSINLVYEVTFLLARAKINFLSIGAVFYFDKEAYLSDQSVDERFIDKRILLDTLNVYNLYSDNILIKDAPVQDLRIIKSVFKASNDFNNLLNIINSDTVYNKLLAVKQHKNKDFTKSNTSLENDEEAKSDIAKYNTAIAKKKYFSNVYFSRNSNKFLGFIFNLDYESLIKDNSAYAALINRTSLTKDFTDKCKISSIKILRRKIEKKSLDKILIKKDTTISLVDSGEPKTNKIITEIDTNSAAIKEINLKTGAKAYRTFAVTDKTVFFENKALYQYGVEVQIADSINQYLISLADDLSAQLPNLKNYLEETNKVVRISYSDDDGYSIENSYDPLKNTFTSKFINSFNEKRVVKDSNNVVIKELPSYKDIVSNAGEIFVNTLLTIGLLKETNKDNFIDVIVNTLNPINSNASIIQNFINSYQRLINEINRLARNNKNNTFTIQNWFINDYIDSTQVINIGYKFISPENYQGLGLITSFNLASRVNEELNKYALNPQSDSADYENKKYCFLSPNIIYSKSKIVNMQNFAENAEAVTNLDFIDLELDIKNNNYFGPNVIDNTNINSEKSNNTADVKTNKLSVAGSVLANAFSIHTKNLFVKTTDNQTVKEQEKNIKNKNVDLSYLMLGLSKQYDLTKNTYFKTVNNNNNVLNKNDIFYNLNTSLINDLKNKDILNNPTPTNEIASFEQNKLNLLSPEVPIHINLLLDDNDRCKLLNKSQNYKKSLELNSKFQFLFNTLHSLEIMEYSDKSTYNENWSLLTKEKLSSLEINSTYLCRLRNYRNNTFGIEGYERIKLPVYEQYFLLFNLNISNVLNNLRTPEITKDIVKRDIINKLTLKNNVAVQISPPVPNQNSQIDTKKVIKAFGREKINVRLAPKK
jgi:hypothetical protein